MDEVHGFWGWEVTDWMFASRIPKGMYLTDIDERASLQAQG